MILKKNKIKLIFRKNKKISKYLSPNVFLGSKKIILSCAVRSKKDKKYSEIVGYIFDFSSKKIKKKIFTLKPQCFYKNEEFCSFLSPFLFRYKNNFYCLIEAKKSNRVSKIIILQSSNLSDWKQSKLKLFTFNKNLHAPSFFSFKKKNYIFFSKDNNKLYYNTYTSNFKKILKKKLIYKIKSKRSIIYAPFIFKINNSFIMFYSFWKNSLSGEIKILTSKNLFNWKYQKKSLFTPNKKFKIISEPCAFKYKKKNYLFFETKLENYWNIAVTDLKFIY